MTQGGDTEGRVLDLAAARAARREARGEAPVLDFGDAGRFPLPIEILYSHVEAFMAGQMDGLRALVKSGAEDDGGDGDKAVKAFDAIDWSVADLLAIDEWLGDVYPELSEQTGKAQPQRSRTSKRSKASGKS